MADKKITQLTNITGANLVDADEFVVVDISADETKAITLGELKEAFDSGSGFVRITGDTMTGDLALSGADVTFGDNDKAIFGAGSDLQIYHDGAHSYVLDNGTGNLNLRGTSLRLSDASGTHYLIANSGAEVSLTHSGAIKLATTATGVDITGVLSSDGLILDAQASSLYSTDATLSNYATNNGVYLNGHSTGWLGLRADGTGSTRIDQYGSSYGEPDTIKMFTGFNDRLRIQNNGDISFYEDTGTTPKFFWDASAESLGIGLTPVAKLDVKATSGTLMRVENPLVAQLNIGNGGASTNYYDANTQIFRSGNGSERMRIDNGVLLVGKTSASLSSDGVAAGAGQGLDATVYNNNVARFNRRNSDGSILTLYKDGSTVGSIGVGDGDNLYISGHAGSTKGLYFNDDTIGPAANGYNFSDNTTNLGAPSYRFKDLYLSGGVYLGGTGAANKLDDYEEGTWTPVIQGAGTNGTYTYSGFGSYTKIGRMVTVFVSLGSITQVSAGSGYMQIAGLPFTKKSNCMPTGAIDYRSLELGGSNTDCVVEFITSASTNVLYLRGKADNYSGIDVPISGITSGVTFLGFSISYEV